MYEDGKCNWKIPCEEDKKDIKPLWSPNGQLIAYLSIYGGKCMLSLVDVKSFSKCEITNPEIFDTVSSYCWSSDGRKILFSGVKNNCKDLYSIDITSLKWIQLTNGNGSIKSYKPQCSSDGNKIAFLRSISNIPNLWISDINGFNGRQVSSCGYIKDFDWLDDGKKLIFASGKGNSPDELYTIDTDTMDTKKLLGSDCIYMKRCIKVSPDKQYLAFIGTRYDENCISKINNIYVYEFKSKSLVNMTRNLYDAKISDLAWKIDSSKIYYSSNELGYYNVYSISLNDFCKDQLTNLEASNIELSYRPRIK
jgi:Tol biopolymer transport system component